MLSTLFTTDDVSIISHTHGRQRRAERSIQRRELQAAIKHGRRERANPGRDGSTRWRFTHNGVVYITDESGRHEVTSWRIDNGDEEDAMAPAVVDLGGRGSHAVLVVDHSGSMRNDDVPGYSSRMQAVYDCLARDFVDAQVAQGAQDVVVSLVSMSDEASVLIDKQPLDASLSDQLKAIAKRRPKSHGNYLPALDKALEIMAKDAPKRANFLLLFLSDGAPSDQTLARCEHGVPVWEIDRKVDPCLGHRTKGSGWHCRNKVKNDVHQDCLSRITTMGKLFGPDKVVVCTVAFGPPKEDFKMLQDMAAMLPRGSFQKLGLHAGALRTAFSSLSSSMTELRTEGGSRSLTLRRDRMVNKNQKVEHGRMVHGSEGWFIYSHQQFRGKHSWDSAKRQLIMTRRLQPPATGFAFYHEPFAVGAERLVYRCTEISIPQDKFREWYANHFASYEGSYGFVASRCGLRYVAKEAKDEENLALGRVFHEQFARIQYDAAVLAEQFNRRLRGPSAWHVSFLPVAIYEVFDVNYKDETAWVLVEPELDGKFTKWNNNAGAVLRARGVPTDDCVASRAVASRDDPPTRGSAAEAAMMLLGGEAAMMLLKRFRLSPSDLGTDLGAILEDDEDSEGEEDGDCGGKGPGAITVDEVPQAFSHFSYEASGGKQLVCDLQGTWNDEDGFMLTDPVVHYVSARNPHRKHKNGATDKGRDGVDRFFQTHKCGPLCARLGLQNKSAAYLTPK